MDKLLEFFKDFKDRLSSPFFSSFIISWLITNWRIPVGLFGYKASELSEYGYSYFELVKQQSVVELLLVPIAFALLYCIGYPWFRNWIDKQRALADRAGINKNLEIMKEAKVSVVEFQEKLNSLDVAKQKLEKLYLEEKGALLKALDDEKSHSINLQKTSSESISQLSSQFESVTENNNQLNIKLSTWIASSSHLTIAGNWETLSSDNGCILPVRFEIKDGFILDIEAKQEIFTIADFSYNITTSLYSFLVVPAADSIHKKMHYLSFSHTDLPVLRMRGMQDAKFWFDCRKLNN